MTYCVAMRLHDGMVMVADSRTNAGVDHIATFRKMHRLWQPGERLIVLMSAGNLATTQSVVALLRSRCDGAGRPLWQQWTSLYEAAVAVGALSREVVQRDQAGRQDVDLSSSFLLGGQIRGEPPRLFHLYALGNFIEATEDTPYFQIGELKYGKPVIDRLVHYQLPLEDAVKCCLISFDSTLRSNVSVGLPLDVLSFRRDELEQVRHEDVREDHPGFQALRRGWSEGLRETFFSLPPIWPKGPGRWD